jgi:excisionase family DNA binding protein
MTREYTLPELTAVYPVYLKLENLPDNCTVVQVAVFSQHSLRHVRQAIREHALEAHQTVEGGSWRIKREAAVRWIEGQRALRVVGRSKAS